MNYLDNTLLSKTISQLRIPMVVGVVFIHTSVSVVNVVEERAQLELIQLVMYYFSQVLPAVCVPLFFFISGFLFFYNTDFTVLAFKRKILRRTKSLFIPYVIWNFIGFVFLLVRLHITWIPIPSSLNNYSFDILTFLNCFWCIRPSEAAPPFNFPMWFIRDLMILVIFSPLLYMLIRKCKAYFIMILGGAWFFQGVLFPYSQDTSFQSLFFFPLGAYFSINHIDFVDFSRNWKWMPVLYFLISFIDLYSRTNEYGQLIHHFGIIIGMISFISIISSYIEKYERTPFYNMNEIAFFIFVSHGILITRIGAILEKICKPQMPLSVLVLYFIIPIVTIMSCLLLYIILKRYMPRVLEVMVGGR